MLFGFTMNGLKGFHKDQMFTIDMRKLSVEKGGSLLGTANLEQTKVKQTFQLKENFKATYL